MATSPITHWEPEPISDEDIRFLLNLLFSEPSEAVSAA